MTHDARFEWGGVSVSALTSGTTSLHIKAGKIADSMPVRVRSKNLIAYGPIADAVEINEDGTMNFIYPADGPNKDVTWEQPEPLPAGTYTLHVENGSGNVYWDLRGISNSSSGGIGSRTFTIDKPTPFSLHFGVTKGKRPGALKIQLEAGDTATSWVRPDITDLEGGGAR